MSDFTERLFQLSDKRYELERDALFAAEPDVMLAIGASKESFLLTPLAQTGKTVLVATPEGPFSRWPSFDTADVTPEEILDTEPASSAEIQAGRDGQLPLRGKSVGMVVCSNLFGTELCHYSETARGFLSEFMRVLKPGGYLVSLSHNSSTESVSAAFTEFHARTLGLPTLFEDRHGFVTGLHSPDKTDEIMRKFGLTIGGLDTEYSAAETNDLFGILASPAAEPYAAFKRKPGDTALNETQKDLIERADHIDVEEDELRERFREQNKRELAERNRQALATQPVAAPATLLDRALTYLGIIKR